MKKVYLNVLFLLAITSYSYNSYAVDVEPKKASHLKSSDFGELVKNYMPNTNSSTSWNYKTNGPNIFWGTGIELNKDDKDDKEYQKSGYLRLTFDSFTLKESSYNNPKSVLSEAAWDITYNGKNKKDVSRISIDHQTTAIMISDIDNKRIEPFKSLIKQNIIYKPVCFYKIDSANYSIAYNLTSPNKKPIYLVYSTSAGSSGYSTSYDLFLEKNAMYDYFEGYIDAISFLSCLN